MRDTQNYTIEKIAPLPECDVTVPTGLNNQGQVCGYCYKFVGPGHGVSAFSHAFFWQEGSITRLRTFGGQWGQALGINKRGDVVGYAGYERRTGLEERDLDADYWPALWVAYDERWGPDEAPLPLSQSYGSAVSLNDNREILGQTPDQFWSMIRGKLTPGARPTPPLQEKEKEELLQVALNRHGSAIAYTHQPTGWVSGMTAYGHEKPWVYRNRKWSRLPLAGFSDDSEAAPTALNDSHVVVGWVRPGRSQYRPYQWRDNRGAFLSTEEGKALGINNKGTIVGKVYRDKSFHACLWKDGKAHDLNDLIPKNSGWTLYDALDINDKGQITGTGKLDKETLSAFLLTPKT